MDKYILKHKGIFAGHYVTVEKMSEEDQEAISEQTAYKIDFRDDIFYGCKTKICVLEALYCWCAEYKESDVAIDSHTVSEKIKKALKIAESLP